MMKIEIYLSCVMVENISNVVLPFLFYSIFGCIPSEQDKARIMWSHWPFFPEVGGWHVWI